MVSISIYISINHGSHRFNKETSSESEAREFINAVLIVFPVANVNIDISRS